MCSKLDIGVPQNRALIIVGIRSDLEVLLLFPVVYYFRF